MALAKSAVLAGRAAASIAFRRQSTAAPQVRDWLTARQLVGHGKQISLRDQPIALLEVNNVLVANAIV
jgi:hypothetical protein